MNETHKTIQIKYKECKNKRFFNIWNPIFFFFFFFRCERTLLVAIQYCVLFCFVFFSCSFLGFYVVIRFPLLSLMSVLSLNWAYWIHKWNRSLSHFFIKPINSRTENQIRVAYDDNVWGNWNFSFSFSLSIKSKIE